MRTRYSQVLIEKTKWMVFTPNNAVTPIFRHKLFNRLAEPGYSYINRITESSLPPIKTSIRVGQFAFDHLLSADNVPFTAEIGVLYRFNPRDCQPDVAAQFVQVGDEVFRAIIDDFATEGLLHLVGHHKAKNLKEDKVLNVIKRSLRHYLNSCTRPLGLSLPFSESLILKKLMPHDRFLRTQLELVNQVAKLESLMQYKSEMFDHYTRMEILNILENMKSGSTVFTNLTDSAFQPAFMAGTAQNGTATEAGPAPPFSRSQHIEA